MSRVEQIQGELGRLSAAELRKIREWLDEVLEDEMAFTPEFETAIKESEREMAKGVRPRVRKP